MGHHRDNLGMRLEASGERERGRARLEEAVTAFRDRSHGTEPARARTARLAMTNSNLGIVLSTLASAKAGRRG